MSNARHIGTQRQCPECLGCGCYEVRVGLSDFRYPLCDECDGSGWIDWREAKAGADPLVLLKDARRTLLSPIYRGLPPVRARYERLRARLAERVALPRYVPRVAAHRLAA